MAPEVTVYTAPPEALVELLARSHFLQGLPLIRRLRFATRFPGGITEHARILWCSRLALKDHLAASQSAEGEELAGKRDGVEKTTKEAVEVPFAAAYLDFSRGPETELWIYSSMERGSEKGTGREEEEPDDGGEGIACAVSLLREVKHQQDLYFTPGSARASTREFPTVLVGNLNEVLRKRLAAPGAGMAIVSTGLYDKWIFKVTELPDVALPETLGDGRRWAWRAVRREDIPFMLSRSKIDRKERTVKLLPSTALYLDDGTPVAWAFLGPDSSLSSLHCEESYRGRGIAKAVAVKVLKDHLRDYSDEPYGWADVALDNIQSQGVCKSLHGQVGWQISWSRLNLDESFPRE